MRICACVLTAALFAVGCASRITTLPNVGRDTAPQVVQTGAVSGWKNFPAGGSPTYITAGRDRAMWFDIDSTSTVARMDMAGNVTTFTVGGTNLRALTSNKDGDIYVGETIGGGFAVAQINPGTGHVIDLPIPAGGTPNSLVGASDGNIWMTRIFPAGIGRLTPAGAYTDFTGSLTAAYDITKGPDKNVWATVATSSDTDVARFSVTDGSMTLYQIPSATNNLGITAASDGGMWTSTPNDMVRVDPTSGAVTTFTFASDGQAFAGPGNLLFWYDGTRNRIGTFSIVKHNGQGVYKIQSGFNPSGRAIGPDHEMWTTAFFRNDIAVLLLHQIAVTPTAITVATGSGTPLTVKEPLSGQKSFAAVSGNAAIATVSGAGKSFTVTGVSPGSTIITVSDAIGNSLDVPVTVT